MDCLETLRCDDLDNKRITMVSDPKVFTKDDIAILNSASRCRNVSDTRSQFKPLVAKRVARGFSLAYNISKKQVQNV